MKIYIKYQQTYVYCNRIRIHCILRNNHTSSERHILHDHRKNNRRRRSLNINTAERSRIIINDQSNIFHVLLYRHWWLIKLDGNIYHFSFILEEIPTHLFYWHLLLVYLLSFIVSLASSNTWFIRVSWLSNLGAFTFEYVSFAHITGVKSKWLKMSLTYM